MTRRRSRKKAKSKKRDWRTTVWYIIGALIVLSMVFSLFASAFQF